MKLRFRVKVSSPDVAAKNHLNLQKTPHRKLPASMDDSHDPCN